MDIPDDPSKPCLSCTKQWCLNQNLPVCAGASLGDTDPDTATGKEGDVEARCFRALIRITCINPYEQCSVSIERDSPRDQLVVTLFLLTVFGLLLGAGIKGRMQKAGIDTSLSWSTGRKWWQVRVFVSALTSRLMVPTRPWDISVTHPLPIAILMVGQEQDHCGELDQETTLPFLTLFLIGSAIR